MSPSDWPQKNQEHKREQAAYQKIQQEKRPKPAYFRNTLLAFIVGGLICVIGQVLINLFVYGGLPDNEAAGRAAVALVFLGSLLTGLGVYDEIGKIGGAGSAIPITGFANSVVAPALEFKREGYILGMSARLFTVAGPVIVYGSSTAVVVGLLYWLIQKL